MFFKPSKAKDAQAIEQESTTNLQNEYVHTIYKEDLTERVPHILTGSKNTGVNLLSLTTQIQHNTSSVLQTVSLQDKRKSSVHLFFILSCAWWPSAVARAWTASFHQLYRFHLFFSHYGKSICLKLKKRFIPLFPCVCTAHTSTPPQPLLLPGKGVQVIKTIKTFKKQKMISSHVIITERSWHSCLWM